VKEMLTVKQEKFVQELVKGKSQRQAYLASYNCKRIKDKTIDNLAYRLMQKGEIRARYEELRKASEAKAVNDATTIRAKLIDMYAAMTFKDAKDYYQLGKNELGETVAQIRSDFLEFDGAPVKSISYDARGNLRLEFYDRVQVADKLRDILGIQPEQASADSGVRIDVPEEYAQ
jgi:phage terminase small subunit